MTAPPSGWRAGRWEGTARRVVPAGVVLATATAFFLAWMHPAILDPRNVGWLIDGHDRGQNAIGLAAYLRDAPPWPSTRQTLLSAPEGLTLLFTDSNPLLGLLLRPFAAVLPVGVQFVGPWLLLCATLQAAFAWALVRPRTPDLLSAWAGTALLTAMPVLVARFGHPNLCAQWMILAALLLFLDPRRWNRPGWWAALLGAAALVHNYLFLLVAAIWASAMLRALAMGPRRWRTLAGAALVVGVSAALLSLHGLAGQGYESTNSYGLYTLALDALWNPSDPAYTRLMPSSPDNGSQSYEGFNYLGAGLLFACALAPLPLVRRLRAHAVAPDRPAPTPLRRLLWLAPALGTLALLALGNAWFLGGERVLHFPLSDRALGLLDAVRASGRLFWPTTYVVAFVAVALTARLRNADIWLSVALALQLFDIAPMFHFVRSTTAGAGGAKVFRRTLDPRWGPLVAGAGSVQFHPAGWSDMAVQQEVEWRAIMSCRPVRFAHAARQSLATRIRLDAEAAALARGDLDPTRLYVLIDPPPPEVAARVRVLDGIKLIPPSAPSPPRRCAGGSA